MKEVPEWGVASVLPVFLVATVAGTGTGKSCSKLAPHREMKCLFAGRPPGRLLGVCRRRRRRAGNEIPKKSIIMTKMK